MFRGSLRSLRRQSAGSGGRWPRRGTEHLHHQGRRAGPFAAGRHFARAGAGDASAVRSLRAARRAVGHRRRLRRRRRQLRAGRTGRAERPRRRLRPRRDQAGAGARGSWPPRPLPMSSSARPACSSHGRSSGAAMIYVRFVLTHLRQAGGYAGAGVASAGAGRRCLSSRTSTMPASSATRPTRPSTAMPNSTSRQRRSAVPTRSSAAGSCACWKTPALPTSTRRWCSRSDAAATSSRSRRSPSPPLPTGWWRRA